MSYQEKIPNKSSIAGLRIYRSSVELEDSVHDLIASLPEDQRYSLANDLRRSSTAISHNLHDGYRRHSYRLKLESIHLARLEAERLKNQLSGYQKLGYGDTESLRQQCLGIISQAWALIRHYKNRRDQQQSAVRINAADALLAARGYPG